jgi:hypothetical protein
VDAEIVLKGLEISKKRKSALTAHSAKYTLQNEYSMLLDDYNSKKGKPLLT